jgi:hypothetical protein
MDTQRLSAVLLIAQFAVLVVGFPFGLPGIYQTTDPTERVQIIEENKTRWYISQLSIGLFILLTAVGFVVLASHLRTVANAWIPALGAAAFVVGAISGALFLFRQTTDSFNAYGGSYSGLETMSYWLWLAGLLLFGVAFLQAGLPAWLGYVTAGATLGFGVFFLVSGTGFITPGVVTILGLVIGIILLRQ